MILQSLSLRRSQYGADKGHLSGELNVGAKTGDVKLSLSEEHCQQVINLVADQLVETAKEVANEMTAEIIDGTKQLEDNSGESS